MVKVLSKPQGYRLPAYGRVDTIDLQLAYKHDPRVLELVNEWSDAVDAAGVNNKLCDDYIDKLQNVAENAYEDLENIEEELNTLVNLLIDDLTDTTRDDKDTVADVVKRQEKAMAELLKRRDKLADFIGKRRCRYNANEII